MVSCKQQHSEENYHGKCIGYKYDFNIVGTTANATHLSSAAAVGDSKSADDDEKGEFLNCML